MVAITVQTSDGRTCTIDVSVDDFVESVLVLAEVELGIETGAQAVFRAGSAAPLNPQQSLRAQGVDGPATLTLGQPAAQRAQPASAASVEDQIRNLFGGGGATALAPAPAATPAAPSGAPNNLNEQIAALFAGGAQRQRPAPVNPDDPEYQRKMYEEIQRRQIEENMMQAMEDTPEAFGSVVMLYVKSSVNGRPISAFVDSGAQMTVMSARVAEECNLTRLIDKRFAGVATGVGSSRIIGRVHMAQVCLGEGDSRLFLPMSITVLEQDSMDFLIGLDQLRRHRMCIDLSANVLRCDSHSFEFLPEHALPDHIRKQPGGGRAESVTVEDLKDAAAANVGSNDGSGGAQPVEGLSAEQQSKMQSLRDILPDLAPVAAKNALEAAGWNVDVAVSMLADD
uniref:CUE domain-containing protein n=1 Tax=Neobodo designis TaxID=312471 RepID=A0A7S1MS56_NEODS